MVELVSGLSVTKTKINDTKHWLGDGPGPTSLYFQNYPSDKIGRLAPPAPASSLSHLRFVTKKFPPTPLPPSLPPWPPSLLLLVLPLRLSRNTRVGARAPLSGL